MSEKPPEHILAVFFGDIETRGMPSPYNITST